MTDHYEKIRKALAHEIWAAAQLAPGEGIADGVARVQDLLRKAAYPVIISCAAPQQPAAVHCEGCGCDWLDGLYETTADGGITGRKWDVAQRAAAAARSGSETREYRDLGNGEAITQEQMLAELAALGDEWRLETPAELYALVDYGYKNQHDAYTRDETLKPRFYWTSQKTPWYGGGRVVVGFNDGFVDYIVDYRALARAVRAGAAPLTEENKA